MMRNGFTWIALALIAVLIGTQIAEGVRQTRELERPEQALSALVAEQPELGPALAAADGGDARTLTTWLVRSPELRRQRLARLILGLSTRSNGADAWSMRYRLMAFAEIGTGSLALDRVLDNCLAYTLVTASDSPAPADLALAVRLAERIERHLRPDADHGFWDTMGCVRFAQGDWARAKAAFTQASSQLAQLPEKDEARVACQELYRARLDAASHNLNPPPNIPLRTLPREMHP